MRNIVLHTSPYESVYCPSSELPIIQSLLKEEACDVNILYWNIFLDDLQREFAGEDTEGVYSQGNGTHFLLLNYKAIYHKDAYLYHIVKNYLWAYPPLESFIDQEAVNDYMLYYAYKVECLFHSILEEIDLSQNIFMLFPANLLFTSLLSQKIKQKRESTILLVKGFQGRDDAKHFLEKDFYSDGCICGIPELALISFKNLMLNRISKLDFSSFVFRTETNLNEKHSKFYSNKKISIETQSKISYHDFFCQYKKHKKDNNTVLSLPLTFNTRSGNSESNVIKQLTNDIDDFFETYNVSQLVIEESLNVNGVEQFEHLLNALTKAKQNYPDLSIRNCKLFLSSLSHEHIRQLSLIGFQEVEVQIPDGLNDTYVFEEEIAKLLFFLKFAISQNICIDMSSWMKTIGYDKHKLILFIDSLTFQRFFIKQNILEYEKCFIKVTNDSYTNILPAIPSDSFLFFEKSLILKIENNYFQEKPYYKLIHKGNVIIYEEYRNDCIVKNLEFENSSLEWYIMTITNENILSLDKIINLCYSGFCNELLDIEIYDCLFTLNQEGLLFTIANCQCVISIIDINV